jgi:CubicO group peptidase (beta-lactamase class C family)
MTATLPAWEVPGTRFQYNNFNTQVLSLVLETVSGLRLREYLSQKLWKPIGAKTAFLWKDSQEGMARAYCCFFARARDLGRLGQLILNHGMVGGKQIVSRRWIEIMSEASSLEPEYGLHIWRASRDGQRRSKNRKEEFLDSSMVYFDGKHRQRVYILPKYDLVIVRTGERPQTWDDSFLPNTLVRDLVRSSSISANVKP